MHAVEGSTPERRPFEIIDILRTPYRIDIPQPIYFVLEDLGDLFAVAMRGLVADLQKVQVVGLFEPGYQVAKRAG